MPLLPGLKHRRRIPEVMDQPGLSADWHGAALAGLARINALSGSAAILWPAIRSLANSMPGTKLRILDVASGGGDVPIRLWRKAQRYGLPIEIAGCDVSATAIAFAAERVKRAGAQLGFFQANVLCDPFPMGYDVIISSLFLHHLDDSEAEEFLRRAGHAAGRLVLINDLLRSEMGFLLACFAGIALTQSDVVRIDARRSVRAAFTKTEVAEIALRAGLAGATVVGRWPCRFLLNWRRPTPDIR